jgi:hypothetical protein
MRLRRPVATLLRIVGVALVWLLAASNVDAAPGPWRARSDAICDSQTAAALKKLLRHPKSYGGPLATRSRASRYDLLIDLTSHARRAKRATSSYDAAAIQNDAPAARVDANDGPLPALRPLGFLIRPVDSRSHTLACSPRSPRGPPASV